MCMHSSVTPLYEDKAFYKEKEAVHCSMNMCNGPTSEMQPCAGTYHVTS